jgi:hypothetical protein
MKQSPTTQDGMMAALLEPKTSASFGRILHGSNARFPGSPKSVLDVAQLHRPFHAEAGNVVDFIGTGDKSEA